MYDITFNRAQNIWMVWKKQGYTAEVVKRFKTEKAAIKWIEKQLGH